MPETKGKRPNFLFVIADDLGFSDISPYGGEISTPALQKLAKDGVRMTNFHTAAACSPTRSMLLTGTDHHIAGLGQLAEHMARNADFFKGKSGYEGYLNFRVAALPEILKDEGYLNILSGKWHLGMKKEHAPVARGFDKVFSYLAGSGNHFNYEPQFQDPKYKFPWRNQLWMDGDRYMNRETEVPKDFYSTTYTTDRMLGFLRDRTEEEKEQPFFAYLSYLAPHWPLQAPKEKWQKYTGVYDDGPEKLGERRVQRLKDLGLVPKDVTPAKPEGWGIEKNWEVLPEIERKESIRKMEVYAGMVDAMDEGIGRVIDYLDSTGELDNTFVMFMSDNGAEGVMLEALPVMGNETTMADIIHAYYDNSLDNIGSETSFTWYGPRWASASTAPSRGWKAWPTEGGIRCPCIVRYPGFENTLPDAITHSFTTVMDVVPTVLELAGVKHPGKTFHGREVEEVRGKSWVSHLGSGDYTGTSVHDENEHVHGWELVGLRAIRKGPWKAVWMHPPRGEGKWELYQVENDSGEQVDLGEKEPEKLKELIECWEVYYAETGILDYPFVFNYARG